MRQVLAHLSHPLRSRGAAAFRRLLCLLRSHGGSSTLSATCLALRPWLMIIALRFAPGDIMAETRSGGAYVAHRNKLKANDDCKNRWATPGPTGRCAMAVVADASATSARQLAPVAFAATNPSGTLCTEIMIWQGYRINLPPPISSRIYPGYSNGVGASMSVVQGGDNDETLAFSALHYGHR